MVMNIYVCGAELCNGINSESHRCRVNQQDLIFLVQQGSPEVENAKISVYVETPHLFNIFFSESAVSIGWSNLEIYGWLNFI